MGNPVSTFYPSLFSLWNRRLGTDSHIMRSSDTWLITIVPNRIIICLPFRWDQSACQTQHARPDRRISVITAENQSSCVAPPWPRKEARPLSLTGCLLFGCFSMSISCQNLPCTHSNPWYRFIDPLCFVKVFYILSGRGCFSIKHYGELFLLLFGHAVLRW